jgi:hypothetical protein
MQPDLYPKWSAYVEQLKRKWRSGTHRLIATLGEAEMNMRREEILKQIGSQNRSKDES